MRNLLLLGGMIAVGLSACSQQDMVGGGAEIMMDGDDIAGVVTGPNGPEAGVWVIAETDDLPTRFVRSVVTDDEGRYVMPDLPDANYLVWSRGYGLLDSAKAEATPGSRLDIEQVAAPDEAAAAELYPALYWMALLEIPEESEFPGTGATGNGINPDLQTQAEWLHLIQTTGCGSCHQWGSKGIRELMPELGDFESSEDAWIRRIQSGQASTTMVSRLPWLGVERAVEEYADWTDRIAAGELPFAKPERPQGVERNIMITQWDFAEPTTYLHDVISSDRRDPTVNANGKIYGSPELSSDNIPFLDPVTHETGFIRLPMAEEGMHTSRDDTIFAPSPYWGNEPIWDSYGDTHNPMMDHMGRVWMTSKTKAGANPDFCRAGSDHPSAQLMPIDNSGRDLAMYDPATEEWQLWQTCFGTHHMNYTEDGMNRMWFSGGAREIGWFDYSVFQETGDQAAAQGWTAFVLDTNGNGVRDPDPVGYNDPVDPSRDKLLDVGNYSVAVSPADGSLWGSVMNFPSGFVRLIPGDNPPETAIAQYYEVPFYDENIEERVHSIRGADIDRNGVMWAGLQSGYIASFDVRKCTGPLNGPEATGRHCSEGWEFFEIPGPNFKNLQDRPGSSETSYYTWVDQHNILGLGENVPIVIGNSGDSLLAVVDGEVIEMRVPYPMGFFAKGVDGRIDDPNGGWKGRALWTTLGSRTPFHMETGKGTRPKVYKFQLRGTPLDH
jgi:hypothetical protein